MKTRLSLLMVMSMVTYDATIARWDFYDPGAVNGIICRATESCLESAGRRAGKKLNVFPGGKINRHHANNRFSTFDFRFTIGKDGFLYAWCMTVPPANTQRKITSLGKDSLLLAEPTTLVTLLGRSGTLHMEPRRQCIAYYLSGLDGFSNGHRL